jgi:hypothetical protein
MYHLLIIFHIHYYVKNWLFQKLTSGQMLEQAFIRITDKMSAFTNKNKAAQIKLGTRYVDGDFCCMFSALL